MVEVEKPVAEKEPVTSDAIGQGAQTALATGPDQDNEDTDMHPNGDDKPADAEMPSESDVFDEEAA